MELHSSSSFSLMAKRSRFFAKELTWVVRLSSSILAILLRASAASLLPAALGCSIMVAITSSVGLSFLCVSVSLVCWRFARKRQVESFDVISWL